MAPILALALVALASQAAAPAARPGTLEATLDRSRRERRPVRLHVGGQALEAQVVRLLPDAVEVRRPDRTRLLVRLDRIASAVLEGTARPQPGGPAR
jgi:hypothetical protein